MEFSCCFMKWEFFFHFRPKEVPAGLLSRQWDLSVPNMILDLIQSPDVDGGRIEEPRR